MRLHFLDDGPLDEWRREETHGHGADIHIDAPGPEALHKTFLTGMPAMARGAIVVNVGAVAGDVLIDVHWMTDKQPRLIVSAEFTSGEGRRWPTRWRPDCST